MWDGDTGLNQILSARVQRWNSTLQLGMCQETVFEKGL